MNTQVRRLLEFSAPPERRRAARPFWLPTLATLLVAGLTILLGQWQWHKAETKAAQRAGYDRAMAEPVLSWDEARALGEAALYRRVRLQGEFAGEYQVWLDNRILQGRAGYHLVVPLRLEGGGAVLFNRGWRAAEAERRLPAIATPAGRQTVEGILVHARSRYLELAPEQPVGGLWQNLDLDRYRAWYGNDLPDWLVLRTDMAGDGLVRDWPEPDAGIERHRAYAVQWFSLAALVVWLWFYFGLVKGWRRP
ncbi:MAG: SURF1 family protein [Thiobacillus sp.]|nr:SURF1 family protein [Thiobacillus sp.]